MLKQANLIRSVAISCHGISGKGVGSNGPTCCCRYLQHISQCSTIASICALIPGHQTDTLARCLYLDIP